MREDVGRIVIFRGAFRESPCDTMDVIDRRGQELAPQVGYDSFGRGSCPNPN